MDKFKPIQLFYIGVLAFGSAHASDPISAGYVKNLSYRNGYLTFKVAGDDGANYCNACPADPGGFGTKLCWIEETKQAQISMLLMAKAQGQKISGRVVDFLTDCTIYQMTLAD